MILKTLFLQNFRNYIKSEFTFNRNINVVAGANAAGKTNLLEAVFLLSTGRSFKAENYDQMIRFSEQFSRVKGVIGSVAGVNEDVELAVVVNNGQDYTQKKFSVNGVVKRRANFAGKFSTVLFLPTDLDIIIGSPSARRRFLDDVLEQTDSEYSSAINIYTKALRQRNALLGQAREQ
ncbi:AAA family ATPase, partial [Patescibacteria group bacterium]|nr:AAA family ATPase [Patescibacteria group bacterium]MBU4098716.1 AAA family ATPase [Patescibacteria group bacterium]